MFTCMLGRYVASAVLLHPSEGADRGDGQLRGDEGYPFNGITNSGGVFEEGAGKRCSVSNSKHWFTTSFLQPQGPENCQLTSSCCFLFYFLLVLKQ